MSLTILFEQFLQEKRYVQNVSDNTVEFYRLSFKSFNLSLPLTQAELNNAIVKMRESGKSPACVNANLRGMRPFVNWLFENEHLSDKLKLRKLSVKKEPSEPFRTLIFAH